VVKQSRINYSEKVGINGSFLREGERKEKI
jgi:hypothetical protein